MLNYVVIIQISTIQASGYYEIFIEIVIAHKYEY